MTSADPSSTPDPTVTPRDPAAYGRRGGMTGGVIALMVVVGLICAVGGGFIAWFAPKVFPSVVPPVAAPVVAAPAPVAPIAQPAPAALAPVDAAPTSADVAALQERVGALEAAQTRTAAAAQAALAASALVEASRASRPFVEEMAAVERLLPPSPETRLLRRLAETGAPSREALSEDFQAAAARAATAARAPADGGGFFDQVAYALGSVISVRRVSLTSGDTPDAVLARAEQLVADGDIDAALAALDALPPRAREATATWRARASRRAEIDRAVAAIRAQALADLQARP